MWRICIKLLRNIHYNEELFQINTMMTKNIYYLFVIYLFIEIMIDMNKHGLEDYIYILYIYIIIYIYLNIFVLFNVCVYIYIYI